MWGVAGGVFGGVSKMNKTDNSKRNITSIHLSYLFIYLFLLFFKKVLWERKKAFF